MTSAPQVTVQITAQGKFYWIGDSVGGSLCNRQVPSVSTVLQTLSPPRTACILKNWRNAELAAGRDPNRHAIRGTLLHQIAEAFLNHRHLLWELGNHPAVSPFVEPLMEALGQLIATEGHAIATEQFVDGGWYAGTFDAQFASGLLLDIKSSEADWPVAQTASWLNLGDKEQRAWLQLMGYMSAMDECTNKAAILVVTPQSFEIRRAFFNSCDLDLWKQQPCSQAEPDPCIEDSIYCRYQWAIAQRQQRADEVASRNALIKEFGL